eukprot:CAMPEP_0172603112 /NCGR_PEP_ID=MMETSP1068-20121228/23311_1 /TAXON_ID=35684 /ORGANISM="Pseudopedinella elastica, Strain CCMP716" /LENGTH=592 /DNA_ID=CAMNT_0013404727 /DNA_START=649 /DNA_END=2429 /DNA_ORIENTATION=+
MAANGWPGGADQAAQAPPTQEGEDAGGGASDISLPKAAGTEPGVAYSASAPLQDDEVKVAKTAQAAKEALAKLAELQAMKAEATVAKLAEVRAMRQEVLAKLQAANEALTRKHAELEADLERAKLSQERMPSSAAEGTDTDEKLIEDLARVRAYEAGMVETLKAENEKLKAVAPPGEIESRKQMATAEPKKNASSLRACANCDALDDLPGTPLSACARCQLVFYCSKPCEVQPWEQKPGGHKQFCVTPEERRPAAAQPEQSESKPTPGIPKSQVGSAKMSTPAKCDECAICLESLDPSSASCCTLPCSHVLHVLCAAELRLFGIKQVCPICSAELPPGPGQLFEEGCRLYFPLKQLVERSGGSWARLTTTQRRTMDKVIGAWKGAADQGHFEAQNNLGTLYKRGLGVPKNTAKALSWFREAAAQGGQESAKRVAELEAAQPQAGMGSGKCANCGALEAPGGAALKQCARCKSVVYCGSKCQKQHWKAPGGHKVPALPSPVDVPLYFHVGEFPGGPKPQVAFPLVARHCHFKPGSPSSVSQNLPVRPKKEIPQMEMGRAALCFALLPMAFECQMPNVAYLPQLARGAQRGGSW